MKQVFTHENPALVGYVKNILIESGIEVSMKNEYTFGSLAPPYNLWPEVWVMDDADFERASNLIDELTLDNYDEQR